MILNFRIKIKSSLKKSYSKFIEKVKLNKKSCPCCNAKGKLKKHAYYNRHVVSMLGGVITHEIIAILRVRCESCKTTHALLPDFIIPYYSYGYNLIMECLREKLNHVKVNSICEKYDISHQLLYTWIYRFKQNQGKCSLIFEDGLINLYELISRINEDLPFFLLHFFNEHQHMLMQIRRSP